MQHHWHQGYRKYHLWPPPSGLSHLQFTYHGSMRAACETEKESSDLELLFLYGPHTGEARVIKIVSDMQ